MRIVFIKGSRQSSLKITEEMKKNTVILGICKEVDYLPADQCFQSVVPGQEASAQGNALDVQILRSHPRPAKSTSLGKRLSNLCFHMPLRGV